VKLLSLTYSSLATVHFSEEDLILLLDRSCMNNLRLDVSGLLLYKNAEFMQLIEGGEEVIHQLYGRISKDPRHTGIKTLRWERIQKRRFPSWSMGFQNLQNADLHNIPGYSSFMNEPLAWPGFEEDPSKAQRLLEAFAEQH